MNPEAAADPSPASSAPRPDAPQAGWRALLADADFRLGVREMSGVALGIGAWGLVTGVAMMDAGLPTWAALLMSLTVFAGTAQLAAAPLMGAGAPLAVILLTAAALNLRFVVFSAQWRPYFAHLPFKRRLLVAYVGGDLNYVLFMRRFPKPAPGPGQWAYFLGGAATNFLTWHVTSIIGILLAKAIPASWQLGFAGTMAMLGMTLSLLGDRRTWLPAAIGGAAALAAFGIPLKLHMLVAIGAAVAVGLVVDRTSPRPPAQRVGPAEPPPAQRLGPGDPPPATRVVPGDPPPAKRIGSAEASEGPAR